MTHARFRQRLRQQLSFIENSCAAYDSGETEEAIRVATCLRVLFHQTRNSTSLLTHLNATDVELFSTCPVYNDISHGTSFEGLCSFTQLGAV